MRYKDYIKNVASSEIHAIWSYDMLIANILAFRSFAMNRINKEWYRNKGYDFTIISSTAFDQMWIHGRNFFENIDEAVDAKFLNYLSRPNMRQPILTRYCDDQRGTCPQWNSQWGSAVLGEQEYDALSIIRYYCGGHIHQHCGRSVRSAEILPRVSPLHRPCGD